MADDLGVWADGFADDGWADAMAVTRWDELHPDEAVRLFPRLIGTPDAREGVAARLAAAMRERHTPRSRRDLAPAWWGSWIVRARHLPDDDVMGAAAAVLGALQAGQAPICTDVSAFAVAFVAGVHPAYLWPETAVLAERWTAVGWLGVLCRGRSALMPLDVAQTLSETIVSAGPAGGQTRDPRLASCGLSGAEWCDLARFASRRLRGRRDVVRLPAWRLRFALPVLGLAVSRSAAEATSR